MILNEHNNELLTALLGEGDINNAEVIFFSMEHGTAGMKEENNDKNNRNESSEVKKKVINTIDNIND